MFAFPLLSIPIHYPPILLENLASSIRIHPKSMHLALTMVSLGLTMALFSPEIQIDGYLLISIDAHGYPWTSMDIMDSHGYLTMTADIHG